MNIIGSRIPFDSIVNKAKGFTYPSQLPNVSWSMPISLDQAYDFWKSPEFAGHTQGHRFIDFVDRTLKPLGYKIM